MPDLIRGLILRTKYTKGRITAVDVLTELGVLTDVLPPVFSVSKKLDHSGVPIVSIWEPVKGTPCLIAEDNGHYQIVAYTPERHAFRKSDKEFIKDTSGDVRFFRTAEDKILSEMLLTESIASFMLSAPSDEEEPTGYYRCGLFSGMGEDKKIMGQNYAPRWELRAEDTYIDLEKGFKLGTYAPKDEKTWPPELDKLVTEEVLPEGRIEHKLLMNDAAGKHMNICTNRLDADHQHIETKLTDPDKNYTYSKRTQIGLHFENKKNKKGIEFEVDGPDIRLKTIDGEFKVEVGDFELRIKGSTLELKGCGSDILKIRASRGGNTVEWTPGAKYSVKTRDYLLRTSNNMELRGKKVSLLDTPADNTLKLNKVKLTDKGAAAMLSTGGLPLTIQATTNVTGMLTVNGIPVVLLSQYIIHTHLGNMAIPTTPPMG